MSRTQIDSSLVPAAATASANATIGLNNLKENFVDNGGMEVWQRGISFVNPSASAYTSDRWQMNHNGIPVLTVTKETTITDGSPSSFKWNMTGVGGGTVFRMRSTIEAASLAGRTVTVSARVRVDSGGGGYVFIDLNDVNGQTPFVPANATTLSGAATWETIYVTRTLGSNVTNLNVEFNFNNVAGVCYIDNVMGVIGSTPVSFVPDVPQVELARCQRYFWRVGQINGIPEVGTVVGLGHATSTTSAYGYIYPQVTMRIAPSVTFVSPTLMQLHNAAGGNITTSAVTATYTDPRVVVWTATVGSGLVAGNVTALETQNASAAPIDISADF